MAQMGTSAVWHDADKSWEMRDLPLPELEADAIQIRVRATSVCGSDLHGVVMVWTKMTRQEIHLYLGTK